MTSGRCARRSAASWAGSARILRSGSLTSDRRRRWSNRVGVCTRDAVFGRLATGHLDCIKFGDAGFRRPPVSAQFAPRDSRTRGSRPEGATRPLSGPRAASVGTKVLSPAETRPGGLLLLGATALTEHPACTDEASNASAAIVLIFPRPRLGRAAQLEPGRSVPICVVLLRQLTCCPSHGQPSTAASQRRHGSRSRASIVSWPHSRPADPTC